MTGADRRESPGRIVVLTRAFSGGPGLETNDLRVMRPKAVPATDVIPSAPGRFRPRRSTGSSCWGRAVHLDSFDARLKHVGKLHLPLSKSGTGSRRKLVSRTVTPPTEYKLGPADLRDLSLTPLPPGRHRLRRGRGRARRSDPCHECRPATSARYLCEGHGSPSHPCHILDGSLLGAERERSARTALDA